MYLVGKVSSAKSRLTRITDGASCSERLSFGWPFGGRSDTLGGEKWNLQDHPKSPIQ